MQTMATAESAIDRAIDDLISGRNHDPFGVLGPHQEHGDWVIRSFHPAARSVEVRLLPGGELRPTTRRHRIGLFEARVPDRVDYRLRITYPGDHVVEIDDPYRYGRVLTDFDLYLLGEGTHHRSFEKLGAHRLSFGGTTGVHFAVWAPNADRVSVIGDFNWWDGRVHA